MPQSLTQPDRRRRSFWFVSHPGTIAHPVFLCSFSFIIKGKNRGRTLPLGEALILRSHRHSRNGKSNPVNGESFSFFPSLFFSNLKGFRRESHVQCFGLVMSDHAFPRRSDDPLKPRARISPKLSNKRYLNVTNSQRKLCTLNSWYDYMGGMFVELELFFAWLHLSGCFSM